MNRLASIDFSINSTSMLVLDQGYHWYHFGREKTSYFDIGPKSFTQSLLPKREKGGSYCQTERMKIHDAQMLCGLIVKVIKDSSIEAVAFEGHSFNSKGNSLLELVSYQFLLRNMITTDAGLPSDRLHFYSPITVKSFAGGARYKKKDMLERFIESDDPLLHGNPVHERIRTSMDSVLKGEDVVKPIDDMVDSYWILKKLQQDV